MYSLDTTGNITLVTVIVSAQVIKNRDFTLPIIHSLYFLHCKEIIG
jgi:hypothetical protein